MVQGPSPDIWIFFTLITITALFLIIGFVGIYRGESEQTLPRYIPEYVDELAQEERIKQELQIAKRVQTSFLPVETPNIGGYDVAGTCHPANETGGDYYDFIQLDDHRMAVVVGDVSGKGIQAAFYMTFIKGVVHSLCREVDDPAELLCKANSLFYDNARRGTFISMVYGILDTQKKTFRFARGGHNPILFKRAREEQVEELIPQGLALGMTRTEHFREKVECVELSLQTDDLLLLYTDGLVEMIDARGSFYGLDRVKYILRKRAKGTSLNMVNALNNDVYRFMGDEPQHDDLTMVSIKVG
jgi:serine phosphatase RsbU (regulator of sigma subunit)